tara:strand:- start:11284 stop:12567 length:1284 start_codon:yes stop_codon:yes gene_type:complete
MRKNLVPKVLLLLFFIVPFTFPNAITGIQEVLDINTLRLYLFSIINTLSLGYILYDTKTKVIFDAAIKSKISIIIGAFIIWGLISYIYAFNKTEVIVRAFTFINFYLSFIVLYVFIRFFKFKFIEICYFISFLLICQVAFSYYALSIVTALRAYDFAQNSLIVGVFPNRNVTAAIYLIQLPFLIYLIKESTNRAIKIVGFILGFSVMFILFLLASRTSYVVMAALIIIALVIFIIRRDKISNVTTSILGYLTMLILLGYIATTITLGSNNEANMIKRMQTIDYSETSTNTRVRYYTFGVKDFFKNPLIGYGLGNFKIISVERDKENINSYVVPYTMHNDFLEVAVELGIVGLILFVLIFTYPLYLIFKRFKILNFNSVHIILLLSISVYLIDSNLNFPFTRSVSLFYLALILNLLIYYAYEYNDETN